MGRSSAVRISALFLSLLLVCPASWSRAQNPGAQQDAEAAREKLLKAEDQLDNIQANSETTKTAVDGMKSDVAQLQATVTKLQTDNAALHQQVADLQAALDAYKAQQLKERQTLIDNVAAMIAAKNSGTTKSTKKKKETAPVETTQITSTQESGPVKNPAPKPDPNLVRPPDVPSPTAASTVPTPAPDDNLNPPTPPPPKPQKGYYHIVASGETLRMIVDAYRDNGVKTSVAAIRKANGLTEKSVLKTGQKLFIPKPGT